ncbi:MAG: HIRAN domain-containing protein [Alphaproteobacteria bacterium]|nr:HIRAN domain-containing protein [Alphaproteobacteria bacterium]MBU1548722.1 HIRAN domain-containing protein [Alphaproteobacteria bacterium]MBU2335548.1 HIRAN domain-containing protein [Alphaproteobacteria bacterium]MBU2391057.1 HIRAN domain-containing protein [Alphaproteobacteria bacterium]
MERRSFLAGAGGALASLPLAAAAMAAGEPKAGIGLLRSYVANRDQFSQARLPEVNEILRLRRRPDRSFDPTSIAVEKRDGSQLGYLPPASTGMLAALLDNGFNAYAVTLRGDGHSEVPLQVYLEKASDRTA